MSLFIAYLSQRLIKWNTADMKRIKDKLRKDVSKIFDIKKGTFITTLLQYLILKMVSPNSFCKICKWAFWVAWEWNSEFGQLLMVEEQLDNQTFAKEQTFSDYQIEILRWYIKIS